MLGVPAVNSFGAGGVMQRGIEKQVVLPWEQVLRIAYKSVRVRLSRSLITTATLSLAVAFVAFTWAGYGLLNAVWPHADSKLQETIVASGYEMAAGQFGSTPKDRWLAMLSLLVCVVGIVNAQLMAVTERFREIGTFKCLGALDSFILRIFVLEAIYQGLLGGVSGAVVGVLVATGSLLVKFGWLLLIRWPVAEMFTVLGLATLLAVMLSFLGVLYPALVAARMQPAVAMRAEQV
jgi:putative ABC transport system permease protein